MSTRRRARTSSARVRPPQEGELRRRVAAENQAMTASRTFRFHTRLIWPDALLHSWPKPQHVRVPPITFSSDTTATAAIRRRDSGHRITLLNFANGQVPGGGYLSGAVAQEEDLCRRIPHLYPSLLASGLYPFGPSTGKHYSRALYTFPLKILREGSERGYRLLPRERVTTVAVISAAAPNVLRNEALDEEKLAQCIRAMFQGPESLGGKRGVLILGAWGCGAFGNDPYVMSSLFARVLLEGCAEGYSEVHFAIPAGRNANVFREVLERQPIKACG